MAPESIQIQTPEAAYMPLIDVHMHLNADMTAERLVQLMDASGVEAMVLMPRANPGAGAGGSDEQGVDYARRYPARFIPFISAMRRDLGPRGRGWGKDESVVLADFRTKLATGTYFGLGEFLIRHFGYDLGGGEAPPDYDIDADHDLMRRTAALVAGQARPILIHAEAEPKTAEQMEKLFASSPKTIFIWAHDCGRAPAADTMRRLQQHPNLMCDLADLFNTPKLGFGYARGGPRPGMPSVNLIMPNSGVLFPQMKALFEAFPDRFMIGVDVPHSRWLDRYGERIVEARIMLAQLTPHAAHLIGHDTAADLFHLH